MTGTALDASHWFGGVLHLTIPKNWMITYALSATNLRERTMYQTAHIEWHPIGFGSMPSKEGTYLIAWSDGTVESYPMDHRDITEGEIKSGSVVGMYWANGIAHPDM